MSNKIKVAIIIGVFILSIAGSYFGFRYYKTESLKADKEKAYQQKLQTVNDLRAKIQQDMRSTAANKNEILKADKKKLKELEASL